MREIQKRKGAIVGSMSDISNRQGISIEQAIANADVIVLLDVSYSMNAVDYGAEGEEPERKTRWNRACDQLALLQNKYQGRVMVFDFSDDVQWRMTGIPRKPRGGTLLAPALQKVLPFDDTDIRFFVISDGAPQDGYQALEIAALFKDPIYTIYIGHEEEEGNRYMQRLANAKGEALGRISTDDIEEKVTKLIGPASF